LWGSRDEETVFCAGGPNPLFGHQYPVAVRVTDGSLTNLTQKRWNMVRPAAWLPDGSGFIMSGWDNADPAAQLWYVTFPDGVPTRIYSDLNDYRAASLTADGGILLAVQRQPELNIHLLSLVGEPSPKQLTFETSGRMGFEGISALPDGRIIYSSETGTTRDLWIMNADGGGQRRLTSDGPLENNPTISPDGQSFVYAVASQGIWRADLDGGNRRQLTEHGMFPVFSADREWVFYTLPRDGWKMWKVPANGGEPVRVTDHAAIQPDVSPDGKLIAYMNISAVPGAKPKLYVVPIGGGEPVAIFEAFPASQFDIHWLADGRGIAYKAVDKGIEKIVSQPVNGGELQTLLAAPTESEGIAGWGFSTDGKKLYYSAGPINHNVVMFTLER
jgi:Tol biopolymer transport system component